MTEEEYTKIQLRYSRASDLTCEINENKRIISNIERGQYHVDVYVDSCRISHELSDETFNEIKDIVLKHYQNKLSESKQKFEEL